MKLIKSLSTLFHIGIFGAIGGTMLWVGLGMLEVQQEDSPTNYSTIEEVDPDGPKWITIEECELDILGSEFFSDKGTNELFIPITCAYGEYYLQTSDKELRGPLLQLEQLFKASRALENSIEMSKKDPEFEQFKGVSVEEQENALELLQQQIDQFIQKHPPITMSISGILDPSFDTGNKRSQLGYSNEVHIIKHQKDPGSSFYTWVLIYGGWIFLFIGLLGVVGFFLKK